MGLSPAQGKWDQLDQASKDFGTRPSGSRFLPKSCPADTVVNLHDISAAEYLAYIQQMTLDEPFDDTETAIDIPPELAPFAALLFAHMAKKKDIHPGDITIVLSQSMAKGSAPLARKLVVQDSVTYYAANQPKRQLSATCRM
jgi:hypothetical protein